MLQPATGRPALASTLAQRTAVADALASSTNTQGQDGLSDAWWQRLRRTLPSPPSEGPPVGDLAGQERRLLEGVLHQLRTGMAWEALPAHFGPADAVARRYLELRRQGVLAHLWQAGLLPFTVTGRLH